MAVRKGRLVVAGLKGLRPARESPVDEVIYKELTIRGVLSMPIHLAIVPGAPRVQFPG
jgi:D-arabinose 1-dehydrogenase-like Zn-dependent alcohol dehydrogenase